LCALIFKFGNRSGGLSRCCGGRIREARSTAAVSSPRGE
jgi:hypothetical protein